MKILKIATLVVNKDGGSSSMQKRENKICQKITAGASIRNLSFIGWTIWIFALIGLKPNFTKWTTPLLAYGGTQGPRQPCLVRLPALFLCFSLGYLGIVSCESPTKSISNAATTVIHEATASKIAANEIIGRASEPEVVELATGIDGHQDNIISAADTVHENISGVEDTVPWWETVMNNVSTAAIAICILIFLWYTGLGAIVKRAVWSLGWFIPAGSRRAAEMDSKILDDDRPVTHREAVAARRAGDPAYNAAYRKLKKRVD